MSECRLINRLLILQLASGVASKPLCLWCKAHLGRKLW